MSSKDKIKLNLSEYVFLEILHLDMLVVVSQNFMDRFLGKGAEKF